MTAVEVAELLDVTEKTIRNWMNANGLPFKQSSGKGRTIDWSEALRWYIDYRHEEGGRGRKSATLAPTEAQEETYDQSLARKTRAEADLKELQLAKARGEVAAISDVERVLAASNQSIQTQMLAVPSRVAPQILGLEDHGRAVAILESEMRQVLTNLAGIDAVREAAGLEEDED